MFTCSQKFNLDHDNEFPDTSQNADKHC